MVAAGYRFAAAAQIHGAQPLDAQLATGQRAHAVLPRTGHRVLRTVRLARKGIPLDLGRIVPAAAHHARRVVLQTAFETATQSTGRSGPAHVGYRIVGSRLISAQRSRAGELRMSSSRTAQGCALIRDPRV